MAYLKLEIDAVSLDKRAIQNVDNSGVPPVPTILHGVKKSTFAENVSEAEKKWLVNVLKAFLAQKKGPAV